MKNQFKIATFVVLVIAVLIAGVFVYRYFYKSDDFGIDYENNLNSKNLSVNTAGWLTDKSNLYEFKYPKDFFFFDKYSTSNPGTSYLFNSDYNFSKKCPDVKDALANLLSGEGLLDGSTYHPAESQVVVSRAREDNNNICIYRYENSNGGVYCQVFITFIKNNQRVVIPRLINNGCTVENVNLLDGIISTFKFTK